MRSSAKGKCSRQGKVHRAERQGSVTGFQVTVHWKAGEQQRFHYHSASIDKKLLVIKMRMGYTTVRKGRRHAAASMEAVHMTGGSVEHHREYV